MEFDFKNKSAREIADEFVDIENSKDQEKAMQELDKLGPEIKEEVSRIIENG